MAKRACVDIELTISIWYSYFPNFPVSSIPLGAAILKTESTPKINLMQDTKIELNDSENPNTDVSTWYFSTFLQTSLAPLCARILEFESNICQNRIQEP